MVNNQSTPMVSLSGFWQEAPELAWLAHDEEHFAYGPTAENALEELASLKPEEDAMSEIIASGWACEDCTFLEANSDTPADWTEERTAEWLAEIARRTAGTSWCLGGEHADACENIGPDGEWLGGADCACERNEFSSAQCDCCGSMLGGYRHAVTFFATPEAAR